MKKGYVYITSNKNRSTFYVGRTIDLRSRIFQHKTGQSKFTSQYNVDELVYFEDVEGMQNMVDREKQLKNWHREWKINLIKEQNPDMNDLSQDWYTKEELELGRRKAMRYR